jgi:hypothetical protein
MPQTGQQQAATQEGWWLEGHGSADDRTAYSAIQPPGEGYRLAGHALHRRLCGCVLMVCFRSKKDLFIMFFIEYNKHVFNIFL